MKEPDYIELGMIEAEKDNGFSVVQRGALSENEVALSYRALDLRPRVPYVAPEKPVQIPNSKEVISAETWSFVVKVSALTGCGFIISNGAIIAGIIAQQIAPFVGIAIACVGAGFLISCLRGGSQSAKTETIEKQTHIHYHQYNYSGNGEQKNA